MLPIACTAYNFFPNGQSKESTFFLMFGRDVFIPTLLNLLQTKLRYLEDVFLIIYKDAKRGLHINSNKSKKGKRQTTY